MQDVKEQAGPDGQAAEIDWVARARALAPMIEASSDRTEQEKEVPADLMAAMHEAEMFRMCLPRSLGGGEAGPLEVMAVMEVVSAADASTAWCLGQALGCNFAAGYVEADVAKDIFGAADSIVAWGPTGAGAKAIAEDGGYRVSGEWRFASGSRHATWLGSHTPVFEADGGARTDDQGRPVVRTMLYPKSRAKMIDVWQVMGLRGTGSDNYTLDDVFVPEAYTYKRDFAGDRHESCPLYAIPQLTFYGMAFAGIAIGLARGTLDAFIELAAGKVGSGMSSVLRDNAVIQSGIAQAEARLGSARAYAVEQIGRSWELYRSGESLSLDQRARLRMSITWAMNQAREAADFAYQASGTNGIFESSPFERRFRDMHTVSQQGQAHLLNFEFAGQALLGLEPSGHRV